MPKSKEDELSDLSSGSASESGSEEEPKPKKKKSEEKPEKKKPAEKPEKKEKKPANAGPKKGDNGEYKFEISHNKFVTVREFKKRTYIDIREFYEKDGKFLPGKKGISLTPEQWQTLKDNMEGIDECVDKM